MSTSEAVTRGIKVQVVSEYSKEHSDPTAHRWFFLYTVTITNGQSRTVQLLSRHWIITDAEGEVEEVKGPGVVGKQPVLKPGDSFEYTSGCPLRTPFGSMHGSYEMQYQDGTSFDVQIAGFALRRPDMMQ